MITFLTACALSVTTLYCLGGWCVSEHRKGELRRKLDAYEAEDWHTADEMAEFAGRCAWHAGSAGMAMPPMVEDHLAASFIAGWRQEEAREHAEPALWLSLIHI